MRAEKRFITVMTACIAVLALTPGISAQQPPNHMAYTDPYQQIDVLARTARDNIAIEELFRQITATTFFGPYPDSISSQMCRMELNYLGTGSSPVTEKTVADAVNYLGKYLGGRSYTGTNELQVRLLRVAMYRDIPHLLKSPSPNHPKKLVGSDLTPAGGVYIALLLLRQKLTNPAWYGDPDTQNRKWESYIPPSNRTQFAYAPGGVRAEEPLETSVRRKLSQDLPNEKSATVAAFRRFLDILEHDK